MASVLFSEDEPRFKSRFLNIFFGLLDCGITTYLGTENSRLSPDEQLIWIGEATMPELKQLLLQP